MEPTAINEQIDRILHSQSFANKGQLRRLLEILHRNMDAQITLRPDTVIKELWPQEIRTKRAADVATEMNRLRHALESYYNGEGKADPITIALPNRSAAAADGTQERRWMVAKPRDDSEEHFAVPPPIRAVKSRRGLWTAGAIVAVSIVAVSLLIRMLGGDSRPVSARMDGATIRIMNAEGKELWHKPEFPF